MISHDWIAITGSEVEEISWCKKCGALRVEFLGEIDPYEYYTINGTITIDNYGRHVGSTTLPPCMEKANEQANQ